MKGPEEIRDAIDIAADESRRVRRHAEVIARRCKKIEDACRPYSGYGFGACREATKDILAQRSLLNDACARLRKGLEMEDEQ